MVNTWLPKQDFSKKCLNPIPDRFSLNFSKAGLVRRDFLTCCRKITIKPVLFIKMNET